MRLIDVDDLGVGRCSKDVLPAAYCAGWNGLLGLIEKAPTVDAVPVVYCKDCKQGMAKQSEYLKRREAEWNAVFNAGAAMAMQFAMDTLQMALHQTEGWDYDRIMRITHNWVAVQREYKPALDCRNPEADVRQEHMDRVLAEIISGKAELIRFPDRYPNAKKIKYGR